MINTNRYIITKYYCIKYNGVINEWLGHLRVTIRSITMFDTT